MSLKDFVINGGLFGVLRGYDYKIMGRPYGFEEFDEDAHIATNSLIGIKQSLLDTSGYGLLSIKENKDE